MGEWIHSLPGKREYGVYLMDYEGEFLSKSLTEWFRNKMIVPEYTPSYSTEVNRRNESLDLTLLNCASTMVNPLGEKP